MEEYLLFRCCLCPNIGKDEIICPGIEGQSPSLCRFVKTYIDSKGCKYKVIPENGADRFKAKYQVVEHSDNARWKWVRQLNWKNSFDEAQADLNRLAKDKKWRQI